MGVEIIQIIGDISQKRVREAFAVCWIKNKVDGLEIDHVLYENVSNSIFFLDNKCQWKILNKNISTSSGYVMFLAEDVLSDPSLSRLHINQVRHFSSGEIPVFRLSPGIEKRIQSILEMIDELLGSNLNHRDDAIRSLLKTFFVYCDGQCNIKTVVSSNNAKSDIVYKFKQLVDELVFECHEVNDYAQRLNISAKYLNECVQEVLSVNSKSIIVEQLLMRSRHALKFSNRTIKEISFELGFSSPDYFSYFFKSHTGSSPSMLRKG